ncbi:MAG TPA: hypothetical protein VIE69_09580 [Methylophilaceae bacterium]
MRSTRVLLLAPGDSAIGTVFPVDPIKQYPKSGTLGHRPLRKRRINRAQPSFTEHVATNHQVDEYV